MFLGEPAEIFSRWSRNRLGTLSKGAATVVISKCLGQYYEIGLALCSVRNERSKKLTFLIIGFSGARLEVNCCQPNFTRFGCGNWFQ